MKKRIIITALAIIFCLCCTVNISAETIDNPGMGKIHVNKANNTITFLYDQADEILLEKDEEVPQIKDVNENAWYYMYVSFLVQMGVIDTSDYYPEQDISKEDFIEMLYQTATIDTQNNNTDISRNSTNSTQLNTEQWCNANNILPECLQDMAPAHKITREETAYMLYQLAKAESSPLLNDSDVIIPTPSDKTKISSWATESTDNLPLMELFLDSDQNTFNPQGTISKAEVARLLYAYIVLTERPTIVTETGSLVYIEEDDITQNSIDTSDSDEDDFHRGIAEEALSNTGTFTPSWTGSDQNGTVMSVHQEMTNQGFYLLFITKENSVTNIRGKYSSTARQYIYDGSIKPDLFENENKYAGHYCSPSLKNKYGATNLTAYTQFNNHYYQAKVYYDSGIYATAYNKLGRAMHYMEDINSPPHAALITGFRHSNYEKWVRDNFYSSYWATSVPESTYNFMTTSRFCDIATGFANYSNSVATECVNNNNITYTKECLLRTQRAVAGLAYRFLIDTNRAN